MKRINVPEFANNLSERLSSLLSYGVTSDLNEKQLYGVLLSSAFATNNKSFINDILNIASDYVDAVTINAAKFAATNIKFKHIISDQIHDLESQLYLLAASFIADFDRYVDIRSQLIEEKLVSNKSISSVVHIAATVHSISELIDDDSNITKRNLLVDNEARMTRLLKLSLEEEKTKVQMPFRCHDA